MFTNIKDRTNISMQQIILIAVFLRDTTLSQFNVTPHGKHDVVLNTWKHRFKYIIIYFTYLFYLFICTRACLRVFAYVCMCVCVVCLCVCLCASCIRVVCLMCVCGMLCAFCMFTSICVLWTFVCVCIRYVCVRVSSVHLAKGSINHLARRF